MACALAAALLCTAWLADDCFFTLRTVEQLLAGRGPRWNAFERVQAYTHPLWMLLLSGAIGLTREYYFTTLAVGLLVTGAAVVWLVRLAPTASARIGALVLLCASRAFVDYSTSGLENPLSHLCGAAALWVALRGPDGPRGVLLASLVTALAALNRLDAVLLFSPLVVARLVANSSPAWRRVSMSASVAITSTWRAGNSRCVHAARSRSRRINCSSVAASRISTCTRW
jgi:arabinofuranosyltransferase